MRDNNGSLDTKNTESLKEWTEKRDQAILASKNRPMPFSDPSRGSGTKERDGKEMVWKNGIGYIPKS